MKRVNVASARGRQVQQKLSKTGADRLERDMLHIRIVIIRKHMEQCKLRKLYRLSFLSVAN